MNERMIAHSNFFVILFGNFYADRYHAPCIRIQRWAFCLALRTGNFCSTNGGSQGIEPHSVFQHLIQASFRVSNCVSERLRARLSIRRFVSAFYSEGKAKLSTSILAISNVHRERERERELQKILEFISYPSSAYVPLMFFKFSRNGIN